MRQPGIARVIDPLAGAEGAFILDPFGALIDQGSRVAAERFFVLIAFDQVLTDLGADALEQEPHVSQHRIIAQDRVAGLPQIMDAQRRQAGENHKGDQHPADPDRGDQRQHCQNGNARKNAVAFQ